MSAEPADAAGAEVVPLPRRRRGAFRRHTDPARFAAAQHQLFAGMNLTISRHGAVHAVAWRGWLDDLELPAPACRQGWSGNGAGGDIVATRWPVTCLRCRRLRGEAIGDEPIQQELFPLPL